MIFRYLFLFFILFSTAVLAYPKMYASVSHNVYKDLKAINTLSHVKAMKAKRGELSNYVKRANKEMKLGYWLDKNKANPKSKQKSRDYLSEIRYLSHQNKILTEFIINTTFDTIYTDKPRSFYEIMKSNHRIFLQDRELKAAIKKYRKKLRKREARRAKQKSEQTKQKELKKKMYLRSSKNLNGKWMEKAEKLTTFTFKGKNLQIKFQDEKSSQKIIGTYTTTLEKLVFSIKTIVRYDKEGTEHKRNTSIKREYHILKANKKSLLLQLHKDESYSLTKQK